MSLCPPDSTQRKASCDNLLPLWSRSFVLMRLRYVSTVGRPRWSRSAISLVGAPQPISLKISSSRSVSCATPVKPFAANTPVRFRSGNGLSTSSFGVCRIPERLSTPFWASLAGSGAFWASGWPGRAPGSKNGPSPKALWALRRAGRQRLPLPRRASRCRSARRRAPGAADRARRRGVGPDA